MVKKKKETLTILNVVCFRSTPTFIKKSRDFVREKIRGSCVIFFIKEIGLKHLNFLIYGFFLFIGMNNH